MHTTTGAVAPADGTPIAFERTGQGMPVILIEGAFRRCAPAARLLRLRLAAGPGSLSAGPGSFVAAAAGWTQLQPLVAPQPSQT
jgi:hypothetical protein